MLESLQCKDTVLTDANLKKGIYVVFNTAQFDKIYKDNM